MLFLSSRRLSRSYLVTILLATNLVISMPAPPIKRSPENAVDSKSGFSSIPQILEIQLPLKIASKDDLVAWARYVMGLMASKINITLTAIKESPATTSGSTRGPNATKNIDNTKQSPIVKDSVHRKSESTSQMGGVRYLASIKHPENIRYAANVGNIGNMNNVEVPANVRPPLDSGRRSEVVRIPLRNGNIPLFREKQIANPQVSAFTISGLNTNSLFNTRPPQLGFTNVGFFGTTAPTPLEITANINLPRTKEPVFKGAFSTAKISDPHLFVPQFPDFGTGVDFGNNDLTKNFTSVSTPPRNYLPVTTIDNLKIPNDPFVTRYFFDGVERKVPNNLPIFASNVTFTTSSPLIFNDEIPLPIKQLELPSQRNSSGVQPLLKIPFEAVITFTRENAGETTTWRDDRDKYELIPTRDPPDEFPPYFDTNYTLTNESGQINVVFDDNKEVTETINDTKKEEKKKQGKKQDSSKTQQTKKQKSEKGRPSIVSQFLKTFVALRKNSSLATDLKPPPLNSEKLTAPPRVPMAPMAQKAPAAQKYPPPPRVQATYSGKPSLVSGQGRRGQTSLAQEIENDDDNGSNGDGESEESTEKNDVDEDDGNGKDDVESTDNSGSNESSSSESEEDDDEGGLVATLINLLQLAAPILEDLSDPESDADLGDILAAGLPLVQELSEGDGETPGFDIPGILVPILLKVSEDENGPKDSSSILTPIIQLVAPLIGPLVGPLVLPLSRQISNPPDGGGSSVKDLIKSLLGPLLEPVGPGKMSQLSNLVAGVISSLSKYSSTYGNSDIASLVKAVVAGTIAGASAGSSGHKDSYGPPPGYGGDSYNAYPSTNIYAAVPPKGPNPLALVGDSIKDILNAVVKVVTSLLGAVTGILGASSGSSEEPAPTYGPPRPTYGAPRPSYGTPSPTYSKPRPSQYFAVPPSDSISITTSNPKRFFGV